jgi:hypothetical protein
MVQKIETVFIDDIDGSSADGTVRFGFDGTEYEIDLNKAHAEELRSALERYIELGRKVSSPRRTARGGARRTTTGGPNPSEVREWAKSQGIEVKDRGRVPEELVVKFKAATGTVG